MTFEAPPGLKKNLQRTYDGWTPDFVAAGPPLRAQLLFVLAWFHAVVQERRSYIPQARPLLGAARLRVVRACRASRLQRHGCACALPSPRLQGWSKFYEFSFADLRGGADIISLAVKHASNSQTGAS